MGFNEPLAARVRKFLAGQGLAVEERRMFGGLTFLVQGVMCCGVLNEDLIVRVGADEGSRALARAHTRPFDFTGRPASGIVYVEPAGARTATQLEGWLRMGIAFATSEKRDPVARRRRATSSRSRSASRPPEE